MNEPDPLISQLGSLSSPSVGKVVRERTLARATRELTNQARTGAARWWPSWALPAVLLACETIYVLDVIAKLRAVFG